MRDALGEKFISGIALYAGDEVLPFGAWMRGAMLATSMAAWLHQLTAATSGPVILAGHGVCGSKAMIATLRWRLIAVPGRLICRPGPFSTARGCQRAPVG